MSTGSLFPWHRTIFIIFFILHFLERFVDHLRQRESTTSEHVQLRQEISQLRREANSLSTPSTFVEAAKLKRQAAAKEKELIKLQEGPVKEKKLISYSSGRYLIMFGKVVGCLWLGWQFWGVPVVMVPWEFLHPFGRMLLWSNKDHSTGLILIGIIPWLLLTSKVSGYLCKKLTKLLHW